MDSSESIHPGISQPPDGCEQGAQLSAYYDGELNPASAARFEQHLAGCDECRTELEEIRELSSLATQIGADGISPARLGKIHRAIDADHGYSILRIAGVLTGLAASAMVIGSVWLSEIPTSRPTGPFVIIPDTDSPAMRVAFEMRVDPLPKSDWEIRDQQMFADARLADFMLDGLSGRPR